MPRTTPPFVRGWLGLQADVVTSLAECRARFPDDPGIEDDVGLLRRVPRWHFVPDKNRGGRRPSSAAFCDDTNGEPMSVYRTDVIAAEGERPDRVMTGHAGFGLVSVTAGTCRQKQQTVHADPLPDETAHALVCGPKTRSHRRWFASHSEWVVLPPGAAETATASGSE